MREAPVLVTGATGYVGGRLIPHLLETGYQVRALGRAVAKLKGRPWAGHPKVELAAGDVLDLESLIQAATGCWAAFYLVHSMQAWEQETPEAVPHPHQGGGDDGGAEALQSSCC